MIEAKVKTQARRQKLTTRRVTVRLTDEQIGRFAELKRFSGITRSEFARAVRSTKAAIEMLDRAAASLSVGDPLRKRIVSERQNVENLLDYLSVQGE